MLDHLLEFLHLLVDLLGLNGLLNSNHWLQLNWFLFRRLFNLSYHLLLFLFRRLCNLRNHLLLFLLKRLFLFSSFFDLDWL